MTVPIAPIGGSFSVGPLVENAATKPASTGGGGFAQALSNSLGKLDAAQADAAQQTQALATGQAQDLSTVVMSVEKASLDVQLASQVRNKLVEAYNDIFRMQV